MIIDLHCHLDLYPNPHDVVAEVQRRRVAVLSVTTTPTAFHGTRSLARDCPQVQTALGLHPELAEQREHELDLFAELLPEARFVGEVGLDGSRRFAATQSAQARVFDQVLRLCRDEGGRVMSIHSRNAVSPVLQALAAVPGAGVPVLHWFTGTPAQADAAVSAGCWFSMGSAQLSTPKGPELLNRVPRERVLTETDGPFTTSGGHPTLPWHAEETVSLLASAWSCSAADARAQVTSNFERLVDTSSRMGS